MINTIEALQGLYVALGGEMSDVENITTIPEMLTAISTVAQAAASELPAVKSTDNNKLLTVVNGKWDKADAPTELPAVTSDDNGNVLSVVEGAWAKAAAPTELPTVAAADKGKYLTVSNNGAWVKSSSALSLESAKAGDITYNNDTLTITLNSAAEIWNRNNLFSKIRANGCDKYYFTYGNDVDTRFIIAGIGRLEGNDMLCVIGYATNPSALGPASYTKTTIFISPRNENEDRIFIETVTPST